MTENTGIGIDRVVAVPWFSMAEWKEVYTQIYSNDVDLQQKGYERLLVWKARSPSLPAGVECSLVIMQAQLHNQEVWPQLSSGHLPAYREQDLKLIYSTAIMRFLNHVSSVAQKSRTIYKMASHLNIPGWIVNIRHTVAHGMTMPPLSVLREALDFAFTWINEHYWKDETNVTASFVTSENFQSTDNKQLAVRLLCGIELWQSLNLYIQVGYEDMKSIPDEKLASDIYNFIESIDGLESKPSYTTGDNSSVGKLKGRAQSVLQTMKSKITQFFTENRDNFAEDEAFTTTLLEGEAFLMGETLLSLIKIGDANVEDDLPVKLCGLWEDWLNLVQQVNLLPSLLDKLIVLSGKSRESPHRRKMAAIWVRELCRGVSKAKAMIGIKEMIKQQPKPRGPYNAMKNQSDLHNAFASHHPDLATAISFQSSNLPVVDLDLIMLALDKPSKWTAIFLPRLLKLAEPALSRECQDNLLKLINIYTAENVGHMKTVHPFIPFTVETLKATLGDQETEDLSTVDVMQSTPDHRESADNKDDGTWDRCEEYHEWEMCPIGVLPWQRHLQLVEFSMPMGTVWTAKPTIPSTTDSSQERTELRVKKINWEDMHLQNKNKRFRGELDMPRKK